MYADITSYCLSDFLTALPHEYPQPCVLQEPARGRGKDWGKGGGGMREEEGGRRDEGRRGRRDEVGEG